MFAACLVQICLCVVLANFGIGKCEIPLEQFYPYGSSHGDQRVPTNDDGSSPEVPISTSFPYFNKIFRSLYVNTNGAISFDQVLDTFTPSQFPLTGNRKIVAPYWCDIDTRNGGDIWFYETNNRTLLDRATAEVRDVFADQIYFNAAWVFVATWDNVAFYGSTTMGKQKRNTFQCILITNGRQSFAIFLYNKIQWTTGKASQGDANTGLGGTPAQVGFDAGDGHNFNAINESRSADVINVSNLSNVNVSGKFIYRMDTAKVTGGGCDTVFSGYLTIFPRFVTMFGGTELSIGGPCFNTDDDIKITFDGHASQLPCEVATPTTIRCVTPMMYKTGDVYTGLVVLNTVFKVYAGITTFVNPINMVPHIRAITPELWRVNQEVRIQWNSLPFQQTAIAIEQFYLQTHSSTNPKWVSEGYVARNVSNVNQMSFLLSTTGQALVYRIHPEIKASSLLPSVWSGILIPNPGQPASLRDVCRTWMNDDTAFQVPLNRNDFHVCPCTLAQARLDITRFSSDPTCSSSSNVCQFNRGTSNCIRMAFQGSTGNDNQCCYDGNGRLIETKPGRLGGFAHRFYYKGGSKGNTPLLTSIHYDTVPFMYCCVYDTDLSMTSDLCEEFLRRRPPSTCIGYIPPRIASTRGDPHLVSLDGFEYTFNGIGEYTLLQSEDEEVLIQGRMEQFKDDRGNLKQASVLTSIGIKCGNSTDEIEIHLNEIRLCDVLVNGEILVFRDTNTIELNGSTIIRSRGNDSSPQQIWTTVTCKSPGVAVNVSAISKMINFNVMISDFKLRGMVKGLLGNFNGRQDDDLTNAYGTIIPINSSSEIIHRKFGLTWSINASESLFTYPVGTSHQSFQKPDFQPVFDVPQSCPQNMSHICGDNWACKFDFCTTGDANVASSTLAMTMDNEDLEEAMIPICGEPVNVINAWWNVTGNIAKLVCHTGFKIPSVVSITCNVNGKWENTTAVCEKIVCGEPVGVANSWWNVTGNLATLVCNPGFKLPSTVRIKCNDNGEWEDNTVVCQKIVPHDNTDQPVEHRTDRTYILYIAIPCGVVAIVIIAIVTVVCLRKNIRK